MSTDRAEAKNGEDIPRKGRRLKLMESYGAFSDERLREVTEKIRGITSRPADEPTSPDNDSARPSGGRVGEPIDETIGDSIDTPIESPIRKSIVSPNVSSVESPTRSPNSSPFEISIDSPIHSSDEQARYDAVLLTENQAILYFCLQRIDGVTTSLSRIARETSISEHTLKSCLKKLREEQLIIYGGRQNCGGRIGFTAKVLERRIILRGDRRKLSKKLQQINYTALLFAEPLEGGMSGEPSSHDIDHLMNHHINHPMGHLSEYQMDHRIGTSQDHPLYSSSLKKELLQDLLLESVFHDLNPHSLVPFLDRFNTTEEVQDFLDMASACVVASKQGRGKPIQNPHGFLFAQLRAGYINPPEGYKSRRILAQEFRNRQIEEELATLRQLKEREAQLRFELFQAQLSKDDWDRLEEEARAKVNPHLGLSTSRQLEVQKDNVLKQWFEQQTTSRLARDEG
jgi:transposase-like protein